MSKIAFLRDATWLNAQRARGWGAMLAIMIMLQAGSLYWRIFHSMLADPLGRPETIDFNAFWSGAHLALHGHAADAFNFTAIRAEEAIGAQPDVGFLPYLYPPVFMLLCLPLGLLPYLWAMLAFMAVGYALVATLLRRILPKPWPLLNILTFPALMMATTMGQSGNMVCACFAGACLTLETRPLLAGACLGLLAFKPHLAVCVPVILLAARRWQALFACGATAMALILLSWAVLGSAVWRAFFNALPMISKMMEVPDTWPKSLSLNTTILLLHGSFRLAYAAQILLGGAMLGTVAWVGARRPGAPAEIATLVCAALLLAPHMLDYDLVCLSIPMAWICASAQRTGWRAWEKTTLLLAIIYPLEARNFNEKLGLGLTPFVIGLLLALVISRILATAPARARAPLL